ncbi:TylF/MycF/NovP-related O-methyltransferase [Rhodovulum kholense]|uniref:Macrocin-O-methyltransferase TylF n=1 Tax=Rhodovulum kholense TaxID=453584 RepID=A0A8E2VKZ3_9RHOB|nr:TylF/MycF/NovP-related O-methyltransferase [Rhodovulum kholense]PTW50802.1 macrocin-O-methyltransferase TylF [Rhodovulum kholense]
MQLPKLTPPADPNVVQDFFVPVFWGITDADEIAAFARAMAKRMAGGVHFADNFLSWGRNNSMFDDQPFMTAWQGNLGDHAIDQATVWRRYILACAGYHAVQLEGDFVECGCYRGTAVKVVVDYLGGPEFPRQFWAYDLFEHDDSDPHHAMPEHGPDLHARVQARFAGYPTVRIVRGRIPEVLRTEAPQKISYLHLDLNQVGAELAALEMLFDRVVPGGIVILDDYEWSMGYRAQKLAEDPWFDARNYRVFPLPTGQGLVLKR